MFSLGVILYTMIACEFPFNGDGVDQLSAEIRNNEPNLSSEEFQNCSEDLRDLILNLLAKDKEKRFSVEDALNHKWFGADLKSNTKIDQATKDKALKNIHNYKNVSKLYKAVKMLNSKMSTDDLDKKKFRDLFLK